MTNPKQSIPLNVPIPATAAVEAKPTTGVNDVTIAPVANGAGSALDNKPDARGTLGASDAAKADAPKTGGTAAAPASTQTTQTTQTTDTSKSKKKKDKKKTTTKTTATTNSPSQ
jgi:cell division septation protein DedD